MMPGKRSGPVERNRAVGTRVRTGCITCKIRRVKCDEGKPSCHRCQSTGRSCDGYVTATRRDIRSTSLQSVVLISHSKVILPLNPSFDFGGNEKERRYFDFFRIRTVPEFLQYFDSSFWDRLVLQASHSEPAVRHALIALGSLHEGFESSQQLPSKPGLAGEEIPYGLHQYNKAIGYLAQRIAGMGWQSADIAMISCILFTCFESLLGNYESTVVHLRHGLRIWDISKHNQGIASSHVPSADWEYLIKMFGRLNLQMALTCDWHSPQLQLISQNESRGPIPDAFSSLDEARDFLNHQSNLMVYLLQSVGCHPESMEGDRLSVTWARQSELEIELQRWSTAFNKYLKRFNSGMSSKDLRGSALLKIHQFTCSIILAAGFAGDECAFDEFDSRFEKIVTLSQSLIASSGAGGQVGLQPSFSSELGIIAPLFFTAFKCRNPYTRRRALSLLSASPRREGMWDSMATTSIANWIISFEERGLENVTTSDNVPESARVYQLDTQPFLQQRRVRLKYSVRSPNSTPGREGMSEEWVSW